MSQDTTLKDYDINEVGHNGHFEVTVLIEDPKDSSQFPKNDQYVNIMRGDVYIGRATIGHLSMSETFDDKLYYRADLHLVRDDL